MLTGLENSLTPLIYSASPPVSIINVRGRRSLFVLRTPGHFLYILNFHLFILLTSEVGDAYFCGIIRDTFIIFCRCTCVYC